MKLSRHSAVLLSSGTLPLLTFNRAAFAGSVVKVALWDKGEAPMDGIDTMAPMGMAMPVAMIDRVTMGIAVDTPDIPQAKRGQ